MIKRTLYFGNPAYLSLKNNQLIIDRKNSRDIQEQIIDISTIPIEDIGVVVLDNKQVTISSAAISALIDNNVALVSCNEKSMPTGLMLPLESHSVQSERFRDQLGSSLPLRKQMWQQTVMAKIRNQAGILKYVTGEEAKNMLIWSKSVRSGDSGNLEARAASFYWKNVFPEVDGFSRDRFNPYPNNFLNYGYAILRAIIARALVSSGLLPTFGIHHHNRYNAFCLADDIMEPYRPFVDMLVIEIMKETPEPELNKSIKERLLSIPVLDVMIDGHRSPLMIAASTTAASLNKCFAKQSRKLLYPEI